MRASKFRNFSILVGLTSFCVGLMFVAADHASAQMNSQSPDATFVSDAASGGMAEVQLGQLAQEKGSSDAVKDFGQKMVTDHGKADDELKGIAEKEGITVPSNMSRKDQAAYDRLSKLQGAEFDREYARMMVRDHQKDIVAFEKEADNGKDNSVKEFAHRTLPTLKEHLRLAEGMEHTAGAM
jgi:putative membrane protein